MSFIGTEGYDDITMCKLSSIYIMLHHDNVLYGHTTDGKIMVSTQPPGFNEASHTSSHISVYIHWLLVFLQSPSFLIPLCARGRCLASIIAAFFPGICSIYAAVSPYHLVNHYELRLETSPFKWGLTQLVARVH